MHSCTSDILPIDIDLVMNRDSLQSPLQESNNKGWLYCPVVHLHIFSLHSIIPNYFFIGDNDSTTNCLPCTKASKRKNTIGYCW